jgi:hypothetical protein
MALDEKDFRDLGLSLGHTNFLMARIQSACAELPAAPRPLAELVEKVLARYSRGAWSEETLAGWRTDTDVTARLAALTNLSFSEDMLETSRSLWPGVGDKVKRMLSSHCLLCVSTCKVSSFHCLCSRMLSVWRSFLCVCVYLRALCQFFCQRHREKRISG